MSKRESERYIKGDGNYMFATEKDALMASKRCLELLKQIHKELGY